MDNMVHEWKSGIEDKADAAREHGSVAQMERYQTLKPRWGNVPYTALPQTNFGRLLFRIRSGTLPLFGFEGKEGPDTCIFCTRGERETIDHFLFDCDGSAAGSAISSSRLSMLRSLRECILSSRFIMSSYGHEAVSDNRMWQLALGCPVEEVYINAFRWVSRKDVPADDLLNDELAFDLSKKSRAHANKLNGRVSAISSEFLCSAWRDRCSWVEQTLQGPRNIENSPPIRMIGDRVSDRLDRNDNRNSASSRSRSRQLDIREFFSTAQRDTSPTNLQSSPAGAAMSNTCPFS
jgi:hypothetical protein